MVNSNSTSYQELFKPGKKKIGVLIDPDKHSELSLNELISLSDQASVDFFLIGGSLLFTSIDFTIKKIKSLTNTPLILFPGNLTQLSGEVDAMMLLSLISGRNPELLIGNHVLAAPIIKKFGIKAIPTGYMLIGTGRATSVEYISNTKPIPSNKTDIAIATAIAGELLGHQLIYMDGGSGADSPIPAEMIIGVKENISIPLIIGGGLKTSEAVKNACKAGADIVIVGNVLEKEKDLIFEFSSIVHGF
jgi:phosphoglycerol geranylgeranyltransferase